MATINDKYAAVATLTISLGGLASSTAGVGRQATLVDNTANLYIGALVTGKIKLGTSPTVNTTVTIYLIRSDNNGTPIIDDLAGASDAGWTQKNAPILTTLTTGPSAATGDVINFVADTRFLGALGPKWTIGLVNSSGAALDATAGNHVIEFVGITQTVA